MRDLLDTFLDRMPWHCWELGHRWRDCPARKLHSGWPDGS